MEKIYFSREGIEVFEQKHAEFKGSARARSSREFTGAAGGESSVWHDNPEYDQAVESLDQRARIIRDREQVLSRAEVIDILDQTSRAAIGTTVVIEFDNTDEKRVYTIGAYGESLPSEGLVSYQAPVARALIGKEEGDNVRIITSDGEREGYITAIHPASYRYRELIKKVLQREDVFFNL